MPDDRFKSLENDEVDREDPLGSVDQLTSQKIPAGVDRRTFFMRSALIGATAIILDRPVSAQQRADRSIGTPPTPQLSPTQCREGAKGSCTDDAGRVLQSGTWPVELAYDWPDAHYL
jgi:hypothetical protein